MISAKELMSIPRKTAGQVLSSIPGGRGYDDRLLRAVEEAMLLEWWRGYYAGLKTVEAEDAQKRSWVCSPDHPWKPGYPTPVVHLLADERGKVIDWERRYGAQAAAFKLARERLIALADECIADREKVAAMMMRVSIATGHGDTIDALLTELEGAIVALQVKEENAYESGYEHGHADATREAIESDLRLRNAASRAEEQIEKAAARRRAQEKEDDR